MALGSLAEVEYLLDFSRAEGFMSGADYEKTDAIRQETGRVLWRFYESL